MRQVNRCLNPQLAALCEKAMELAALNNLIKKYLPLSLVEYCRVGSFNKGCLVIVTASAWATELRYIIPDLRDKLRKQAGLYQLTGIKISIDEANEHGISTTKMKKAIQISDPARAIIYTASSEFTYEPLKKALQKLAR
ncbi:Zn-ribbon-containing, possible RNA-binding protein-like protein [Legionella lansingensis]|uniref:DUF721 domain-containing protein n=1 Tax=Legionella lansingensis TaxID=45067 RepID=A0A0W0VR40_9GAMM|nr:DUF721 domain-containing protein [Legionella lansingensis]KTD22182.1 hypothetical protein Llan_1445 [Legionella lansingensis]SNV54764.1 Zn-ribbon-containing, possible RNA-binding protein-like protein [Legionella lansingensis]